jgi:hypothetical protein
MALTGTRCAAHAWPPCWSGWRSHGVSRERTDQGRTPRLVKTVPPTDADLATVVQTISRRVRRTLRTLGSLEAGTDARRRRGDGR